MGVRYRRRLWQTPSTRVTLYSGPRIANHIEVDIGKWDSPLPFTHKLGLGTGRKSPEDIVHRNDHLCHD